MHTGIVNATGMAACALQDPTIFVQRNLLLENKSFTADFFFLIKEVFSRNHERFYPECP